jgi:type I restriction enzyme S subunit
MSDAVQSEQVVNMAKGWVQAPLDIPPLPVQERIAEITGAVDDQITALDTEAEAATALRVGLLAESLTTSQGEEWEEVRLSEVSSPLAGPAFKASAFASKPVGPRLLRGINLGRSGTRWNDADTVFWPEAESGAFQKYVLEPGDICIAMDRPFTRDRVLRCGLIKDADLPALLVQRVTRLRANRSRVMPEFLILVVQSRTMAERLAGRQTPGGYAPHISGRDISEFTFALPPLSVQERIVEVIGAVDDQIAALDAEADVLDELWWALGREMEAAVADEGTVPLASFCDISGGLTKNKKDLEQPDLVEVPYLRVANVHRHHLNLSEVATIQTTQAKAEKLRLHPGDVLMNEGGDKDKLGRGHVWEGQIPDCIHQNHVFRVRVTDQRFDPYFVSAWGNTFGREWFETFGTQTTGIASINRATLSRFPVPDVPLSVQQDWAGRLGTVVETMDSLRVQAASLRQVRAGLLSGLLDRTIDIESAEQRD